MELFLLLLLARVEKQNDDKRRNDVASLALKYSTAFS